MSDNIVEKIMDKSQLISKIQRWVLLDSQLKIVNDKTKQLREMRSQLNSQISQYMLQNNMSNTKIDISDGDLRICEKKDYSSITFGYIERCLDELISDKTQVEYIIKYLKENREVNVSSEIKRTYKKK